MSEPVIHQQRGTLQDIKDARGRVMTAGGSSSIGDNDRQLIEEIRCLKEEKKVYMIAHYYRRPEIQDNGHQGGHRHMRYFLQRGQNHQQTALRGPDFLYPGHQPGHICSR